MHDEPENEGDAGLGAAPQGTSEEGRPDVEQDPDADDTLGGGQHHTGAGAAEEPQGTGAVTDDPEQSDPESGAAADQSERPDAGHA